MSKNKRLLAGVICVLGAALVVIACGLFRGHFDHGQFEVKETSRSSAARVAMVAKRSDHEAMSGDQYFVSDVDSDRKARVLLRTVKQ